MADHAADRKTDSPTTLALSEEVFKADHAADQAIDSPTPLASSEEVFKADEEANGVQGGQEANGEQGDEQGVHEAKTSLWSITKDQIEGQETGA